MFKVCGIIGISKMKFFNFPGTERVQWDNEVFLSWFMNSWNYFSTTHKYIHIYIYIFIYKGKTIKSTTLLLYLSIILTLFILSTLFYKDYSKISYYIISYIYIYICVCVTVYLWRKLTFQCCYDNALTLNISDSNVILSSCRDHRRQRLFLIFCFL